MSIENSTVWKRAQEQRLSAKLRKEDWQEVQEEQIDKRIEGKDRSFLIEDMLLSIRVLSTIKEGDLYEWHLNRANYIAEKLGIAPYEGIDTDN